jgi:hypothetical protein
VQPEAAAAANSRELTAGVPLGLHRVPCWAAAMGLCRAWPAFSVARQGWPQAEAVAGHVQDVQQPLSQQGERQPALEERCRGGREPWLACAPPDLHPHAVGQCVAVEGQAVKVGRRAPPAHVFGAI